MPSKNNTVSHKELADKLDSLQKLMDESDRMMLMYLLDLFATKEKLKDVVHRMHTLHK